MRRFFKVLPFFFIVFLFLPSFLSGAVNQKKTVVIPAFYPDFDKSAFKSPDLPNSILIGLFSFYLNDPDISGRITAVILTNTEWDPKNSERISGDASADFLVSGTYRMTGDPVTPDVSITMTVYDAKSKKNILVKTGSVPLGSKLYDLGETIISSSLKALISMNAGNAKAVITGFEKTSGFLKILINGNPYLEFSSDSKEITLPLLTGRTNVIVLQNSESKDLSRLSLNLNDGETTNIRLIPNPPSSKNDLFRPFHFQVYTMDETMAGAGIEYFFTRNIWAGLDAGFSAIPDKNLFFILPVAEAGYKIPILPEWKFSVSGGLLAKGIIALPQNKLKEILPDASPFHMAAGLFLEAEWFGVFVRPAAYYDGSTFYFNGSAGYRF